MKINDSFLAIHRFIAMGYSSSAVYTLWQCADLIPYMVTSPPVFEKISRGAGKLAEEIFLSQLDKYSMIENICPVHSSFFGTRL